MKQQIIAAFQKTYGHAPAVLTRAPGRIEFIGNHTDYNGGTVLGASIDRGVWVALRATPGPELKFFSEFSPGLVTVDARAVTRQNGAAAWTNYPLGVFAGLPAFGLTQPAGFEYAAVSDLPPGAGLSSSAAIELASGLAMLAATGQNPPRETLVKLGRHAENNFVGVPCGILDQGVSGFGQANRLVFIDCRGPRFDTVPLPPAAHFWIFNTHTKHALVEGLYAERHRECMDAARKLGVALLADLSPADLEARKAALSDVLYRRAKHVVGEIARVAEVKTALANGDLATVGRALNASHESSRTQFENSTPELDFLAAALAKTAGVHGARLTGGGFGGAVMALTTEAFDESSARSVVEGYAAKFGQRPEVIHCRTAAGAEVL